MGNIGIIGRARVGKDTAGAWLIDNRGYRRVAFADPLKAAALELDPIVEVTGVGDYYRLGEEVARWGWEGVKDDTPEVRRILQELGRSIRTLDPEFWLRLALKTTQEANDAGVPVVITDVRYPNEAEALRRAGFHLIYIHRPGVPQLDHESEGALTAGDADYRIVNSGDVYDLHQELSLVADRIYNIESRKHFARL
ncbi:hypothetical protein [Streptomyces sp. NPDC056291]|uniref:deoxynucleotide monophosphate kinase family protein n=1 Tax=Streptomyces sp. NPDC056291 TaxID=3345772 RepID=UPI0035E0A9EE